MAKFAIPEAVGDAIVRLQQPVAAVERVRSDFENTSLMTGILPLTIEWAPETCATSRFPRARKCSRVGVGLRTNAIALRPARTTVAYLGNSTLVKKWLDTSLVICDRLTLRKLAGFSFKTSSKVVFEGAASRPVDS